MRSTIAFVFLVILLIIHPFLLSAQTYPTIVIDYQKTDTIHISASNTWIEVPPAVVKGGWSQYYCTSADTRIWDSPLSIADSTLTSFTFPYTSGTTDGVLTSASLNENIYYTGSSNRYLPPFTFSSSDSQWKRNYSGSFSAFRIDSYPGKGDIIVGINHTESKNEKVDIPSTSYYYQNTVRGFLIDQNNAATYSGVTAGAYHDCWPAYFSFLTAGWVPNNSGSNWGSQMFTDLGPVAWPSQGYVDACGQKVSNGIRHPSAFVHNDSMYIYYIEGFDAINEAPVEDSGREWGVKVVKVNVNDMLDPSKYKVYYNGSWVSSLPSGFSAGSMLSYVSTKGPQSTRLLGKYNTDEAVQRFSVSKISGTDYFLGIEWYVDWLDSAKYKTAFHLSQDLTTWSGRLLTLSTYLQGSVRMAYPVALNLAGDDHSNIDPSEFYIFGTPLSTDGLTIDRTRLKMRLVETMSMKSVPNKTATRTDISSTIISASARNIIIQTNLDNSGADVLDMGGNRVVYKERLDSYTVIPVVSAGVYIVRIRARDGSFLIRKVTVI
jgi:hypothetical protein